MDHIEHLRHQIGKALHLRTTKLIGAWRRRSCQPRDRGLGNIIDINRLEPGGAPCDRQDRAKSGHARKPVKELIFRTKDNGRPQNHRIGESLKHRSLTCSLGAGIFAGALGICTNGGNMNQTLHPRVSRDPGDPPRAFRLNCGECVLANLIQDTNAVHHRI